MSHERFEELVIAHAVDGTLDADGARELIPHLAGCDECRNLLRDLEGVAGDLALAAPPATPPAGLEQRIVDAARATAPVARTVPIGRARRMLGVAAAVAALALGSTSVVLYNVVERERRDDRAIATALDLIGDPDARIARLSAPDGDASGIVAIGDDGSGVLVVDDLPATPQGKVHELWLIADGKPRAIDVFSIDGGREIVAFETRVRKATAAAITLEDGPLGSPVPTGDMLLSGDVA